VHEQRMLSLAQQRWRREKVKWALGMGGRVAWLDIK